MKNKSWDALPLGCFSSLPNLPALAGSGSVQDMFPIVEKYIKNPYIKQNAYMEIRDPKKISAIEKNAKEIIKLMRHGVKFTPTQPDSVRIEKLMIEELNKGNNEENKDAAN